MPNPLAADEVQALLDSCDRSTASGKRDLAVLLLLARMGLRAAEVAELELDDFDWRAGELVVHGKGRRCDRMPLPAEVGEAVGRYLLEARPRAECRTAFLTLVAPPRPMQTTTIGQMVWRQCRIVGIEPVRAHRLRHVLATELLANGVRLPEIAQVLRQRDLGTAAVYAKVDYPALRELALPWLVVRGAAASRQPSASISGCAEPLVTSSPSTSASSSASSPGSTMLASTMSRWPTPWPSCSTPILTRRPASRPSG